MNGMTTGVREPPSPECSLRAGLHLLGPELYAQTLAQVGACFIPPTAWMVGQMGRVVSSWLGSSLNPHHSLKDATQREG